MRQSLKAFTGAALTRPMRAIIPRRPCLEPADLLRVVIVAVVVESWSLLP
jgi:hypothetical protein